MGVRGFPFQSWPLTADRANCILYRSVGGGHYDVSLYRFREIASKKDNNINVLVF